MTKQGERGAVEGFYGKPFTLTARKRLFGALAQRGHQSYLLCPKADHSLRSPQFAKLTEAERREIVNLVDEAAACGISLIVGLSPLGIVRRGLVAGARTDQVRRAALVARAAELRDLGVRRLALLFDDTAATFVPLLASGSLGAAHAELSLEIAELLADASPSWPPVLLVGAIYHGTLGGLGQADLRYLHAIAERVGTSVPVGWTGSRIFSRHLSELELVRLEAATGLRLWVWNNAIANDWLPMLSGELVGRARAERLLAAPAQNFDPANLAGRSHFLNAMREPELTALALQSFEADAAAVTYARRWELYEALKRERFAHAPAALDMLQWTRRHPLVTPWLIDGDAAAAGSIDWPRWRQLETTLQKQLGDDPALGELLPTARSISALAGDTQARSRLRARSDSRWISGLHEAAPGTGRGRNG